MSQGVYPYLMGFFVPLILGAFLIIRSLSRMKEWREGEKDQLWNFLSLLVGGVASILFGITFAPLAFGASTLVWYYWIGALLPVAMYVAIAAIGLTTYYLYLQWRESK